MMNLTGNNNINNRLSTSSNDQQHPFLYSAKEEAIDLQKLEIFLKNGNENCCIIRSWFPKIVQRSYGKEKRFFCPPPLIALLGNGWNINKNELILKLSTYQKQLQQDYRKPGITPEEQTQIKALLSKVPNLPLRINLNVGINDGTTPFVGTLEQEVMIKTLFINSVDRRRYFKLSCELTDYLGPSMIYPARLIGNFESSEIRVVSKPPKKQSIRAIDSAHVNLKSGMQVALFNRIRSHGVTTRYLYVDEPIFIPSLERWSSFYIYTVDTDEKTSSYKTFAMQEGFICYNQVVRLVDVLTGISSPNIILRRIEKNIIEVSSEQMDEPIAMLQRVAFQLYGTASTYLALSENSIVQKDAKILSFNAHEPNNSITWSITNCEMIEYKFFELMGPTIEPIAPVPLINRAEFEGGRDNTAIEFCGINLGQHLNVYFGIFKCRRLSANHYYIRCNVPSLAEVTHISSSENGLVKRTENGCYQVPISFIRNDGVVYPLDMEFQYSRYPFGEIGKVVFLAPTTVGYKANAEEDGNKLLETTLTEDDGADEKGKEEDGDKKLKTTLTEDEGVPDKEKEEEY